MESIFDDTIKNEELLNASISGMSKEELELLVAKLQRRLIQSNQSSQGPNLENGSDDNATVDRFAEGEKRYRFLFENAPVGVFRSTPNGGLIDVNPALAAIFGFPDVRSMLNIVHDLRQQIYANPQKRLALIRELNRKKEVENFEFEGIKQDGSHIWLSLNARVNTSDPKGDPIIEGFIVDITDKKNFEDEILKHNKKLEELNATKDKFFSIIAHDLRNPFNGLQALSMLLVKHYDEYDKKQALEILDLINQSAEKGVRLLENLLEWSRAQTGKIEYSPESFKLADIVSDTLSLMGNQALKKRITLHSHIHHELTVFADRNMIFTALRNLISNAIKFTFSRGEVHVKAEPEDENFIKVIVSDNGMGIIKESQELLFKLGRNFSAKGTANESGTGLGLILCKDFVEKNGGRIWVESVYEKGSDFIFTVPLHDKATKKNVVEYDTTA